MISSGLIKKGEDGKFSAQEGHVALTYVFGKTVLDLVGEIGSAASTIKELIRANLKPGEDYVNLKTGKKDCFRVNEAGIEKLKRLKEKKK